MQPITLAQFLFWQFIARSRVKIPPLIPQQLPGTDSGLTGVASRTQTLILIIEQWRRQQQLQRTHSFSVLGVRGTTAFPGKGGGGVDPTHPPQYRTDPKQYLPLQTNSGRPSFNVNIFNTTYITLNNAWQKLLLRLRGGGVLWPPSDTLWAPRQSSAPSSVGSHHHKKRHPDTLSGT